MSLDVRTLYPHLHAENTRHLSSSPRTTSSKGTNRKKREADPPRSPTKGSRLPRTRKPPPPQLTLSTTKAIASLNQMTARNDAGFSSRAMPPLPVSRPSTPATPDPSSRSADSQEITIVGPLSSSKPKSRADGRPTNEATRFFSKTRAHVLRGDLANTTNTAQIDRKPPRSAAISPLIRSSSSTLLASTQPLDEMVQCNARPRSRYARREIATPMQPLPSRLSQSESAPAIGAASRPSSSTSISELPLRESQSAGTIRRQEGLVKPPILSWTAQDASSFFLTEIDAKEAADQWAMARALARGAHLLYAQRAYEPAVACLADALHLAEEHAHQSVVALAHHHMGVAFHEDGQAKWALLMQKKALELAQACHDPKLEARALKAVGVLLLDRGEPQKALDCQQQALTIAIETGDCELEARVYANLGNLASAEHQWHHALACHERDLAACSASELDSAVGQARAHRNLGLIYAELGEKDAQLDHELQAARLDAMSAFETDMRRHTRDVVGNIYLQVTAPHATIVDMVATSIEELLLAENARKDAHS